MSNDTVRVVFEMQRRLFDVFFVLRPTAEGRRELIQNAIIDALAEAIKSEADSEAVRRSLRILLGVEPPMDPSTYPEDVYPGEPPDDDEEEEFHTNGNGSGL